MKFLNKFKLLILCLVLLLVIFNFQLFGVPFNFIVILFFLLSSKYLKFEIERFEISLLYFLFLGLALYLSKDNVEGLKFVRTLISIVVLRAIFINFLRKLNYWKILFHILFIHTLVVLVSFFYPQVVDIVGPFFGFEKDIKLVRFPGLTSGYDISGIVIISSIIVLDNKRQEVLGRFSFIKYYLYFFISLIGLLLTSRFSIAFFLIYLIFGLTYNSFHRWILAFSFLIIYTLFPSINELIDGILMTLNLKEIERGNFYYEFLTLNYSQSTSIEDVTSSHYLLFYNNFLELFFGFADVKQRSDVGYVNYINNYGFVNLFFILIIYFKYFFNVLKLRLNFEDKRIFYFIFFLFLIATFKNNYIFSRTSFEIFYLIYLFTKYDLKFVKV